MENMDINTKQKLVDAKVIRHCLQCKNSYWGEIEIDSLLFKESLICKYGYDFAIDIFGYPCKEDCDKYIFIAI